jgi:hypothetical protein
MYDRPFVGTNEADKDQCDSPAGQKREVAQLVIHAKSGSKKVPDSESKPERQLEI